MRSPRGRSKKKLKKKVQQEAIQWTKDSLFQKCSETADTS
jgi:hypothetical protein